MIHELDRLHLEKGETLANLFGQTPRFITVDKTLVEGDIIKTKNFEFVVVWTPGHTDGSICLYEKEKHILISGDTLFSEGPGRYDLPYGDKKELVESLKKLSEFKIELLLPGHGEPRSSGIDFILKRGMNI